MIYGPLQLLNGECSRQGRYPGESDAILRLAKG